LCRDFTAIGPVINLAARLQSAANLGEVVVSAPAREQVGRHVDTSGPRELKLKGIEQSVSAYTVQAFA
jgi:adenylate cyclase